MHPTFTVFIGDISEGSVSFLAVAYYLHNRYYHRESVTTLVAPSKEDVVLLAV